MTTQTQEAQARAAFEDLLAQAKEMRNLLRKVAAERRKFGPISTAAQDRTIHLTNAIERCDDALAAWCARQQSEGEDLEHAARYRWLRQQHWENARIFVVAGSKEQVRLGTDCPSDERLDAMIDAARAEGQREPRERVSRIFVGPSNADDIRREMHADGWRYDGQDSMRIHFSRAEVQP